MSIRANHPVAGHQDRYRVLAQGGSNRSYGVGTTDLVGDPPVGANLARRDGGGSFQNCLLEVRLASPINRYVVEAAGLECHLDTGLDQRWQSIDGKKRAPESGTKVVYKWFGSRRHRRNPKGVERDVYRADWRGQHHVAIGQAGVQERLFFQSDGGLIVYFG